MEYLARLPLFVRVVRLGSFAAVAREVDMTPSAVSKQIQRLESELGVRLFQRTTRQLALTDEGQRFYEQSSPLVEGLLEASDQLKERQLALVGKLRVSVPGALLNHGMSDAFAEFALQHPALELQVEASERLVDLLQDHFDMAIRIAALEDSSLVARRLAPAPMWLVASPDFVAVHGTPIHPEQWIGAPMVTYAGHGRQAFRFEGPDGAADVRFQGRLQGDSDAFLLTAARHHLGFCIVPAFAAQSAVKSGQLVRLLADWTLQPERSIWAVYPHRQHLPIRTRTLIDHLVGWFDRNTELG
ncbi:LysR substrate-binding domain-containing protein [Litorivicinus lipolyticus]|uniref:LysR family transcriptional regulator n=1 Tax=Litorivicinus lipolyticus TaxID=418701 RepID=UPI003B5A3AB6